METPSQCIFCAPDQERIFFRGHRVYGIWDAFPVSDGHALLIPYRHAETWFDATEEELHELCGAIQIARQIIRDRYRPDGFNIGINAGAAAGQTIFHLHVHIIPRYRGDVEDPRGGVRYVIPKRANYLADPQIAKWSTKKRQPGSAEGIIKVQVEDEKHLDDFREYMS